MTALVAAAAPSSGTDWTLIGAAAVTGLTAILVGVFGYLGIRRSAAATIEIASLEGKRQDAERLANARERRAAAYKQFLVVERRLAAMPLQREPLTVPQFHEWFASFQDAHVTLLLHGAGEVLDATKALSATFYEMWAEVGGTPDDARFDARFRAGLERYVDRSQGPREALTEAMRADAAASGVESEDVQT